MTREPDAATQRIGALRGVSREWREETSEEAKDQPGWADRPGRQQRFPELVTNAQEG